MNNQNLQVFEYIRWCGRSKAFKSNLMELGTTVKKLCPGAKLILEIYGCLCLGFHQRVEKVNGILGDSFDEDMAPVNLLSASSLAVSKLNTHDVCYVGVLIHQALLDKASK